jgi:hypothetical protein
VVVANQVSDVIGPDEHAKVDEASCQGGDRRGIGSKNENFGQGRRKEGKVAAMGLAWAQAVNTRLVLQRCRPRCLFHDAHQEQVALVGRSDVTAGAEPVGLRQVSKRFLPVHADRSLRICSRSRRGCSVMVS